jgi:hypothetical protein
MRKMAIAVTWICYSSPTNRAFCILGEVGAEVKCLFKAHLPKPLNDCVTTFKDLFLFMDPLPPPIQMLKSPNCGHLDGSFVEKT